MGFSGGGSNVLKSHTHDGTITEDGGSLNMDNITQAGLTAGDVVYSDGVHLQRLAIGAASEVLEVNGLATAPQWAAAPGGGATLTRGYATSSTEQSTSSAAFVDLTSFSHVCQAGAGMAMCYYVTSSEYNNNTYFRWNFSTDGAQPEVTTILNTSPPHLIQLMGVTSTLSAQTVTMQFRVHSAGNTAYVQRNSYNGIMYVLEIS